MKTNLLFRIIRSIFFIFFEEAPRVFIRDRKGRFAKEPEVIKFYPIKRNLYHE